MCPHSLVDHLCGFCYHRRLNKLTRLHEDIFKRRPSTRYALYLSPMASAK